MLVLFECQSVCQCQGEILFFSLYIACKTYYSSLHMSPSLSIVNGVVVIMQDLTMFG